MNASDRALLVAYFGLEPGASDEQANACRAKVPAVLWQAAVQMNPSIFEHSKRSEMNVNESGLVELVDRGQDLASDTWPQNRRAGDAGGK